MLKTLSCIVFSSLAISLSATAAISLNPIHDNNTNRSTPSTATTGESVTLALKVASSGQGNARIAYLQFDLTGATTAEHGNDAAIVLTTSSATTTQFSVSIFALNNVTDSGYLWTESGITWSNSPGFLSTGTNFLDAGKVTNLGSFVIPNSTAANTKFSVNFSDWDTYRQPNSTLTLIALVTAQSNAEPILSFHSSEAALQNNQPTLVIPEPTSAALISFAALGLLRRKR